MKNWQVHITHRRLNRLNHLLVAQVKAIRVRMIVMTPWTPMNRRKRSAARSGKGPVQTMQKSIMTAPSAGCALDSNA